ncbi:major facilitator superfamily domain-containing protein [Bipolaris maydis]|nr:major facilitator superfamily domain-containing protein [Bipolaris maydis]
MPLPASERTPLLRSVSQRQQNAIDIAGDEVTAAEFPAVGNDQSNSHGQSFASVSHSATGQETEELAKFEQDGKLQGVGVWRFRCVFGGILLGYFIAMFDSTLMASSHPVITSYFHASNSASWLSTAFLLTSTSHSAFDGPIFRHLWSPASVFGRPRFTCCYDGMVRSAQSIASFILARAFCGIGAAGVLSMGNIMTNDLVSIEVRGKYQAYINLFYGGGSACGAAFGGFLCDKLGWRMTFALQVPVILILLINAIVMTPSSLGPNLAKRFGLGFRDAMNGFDIAGPESWMANVYPWKHWLVITSLVVALITGVVLIRIGMNTILFNAPLYFQAVELESASVSGFRLAGPSVALTVCGVSAGFIMTATGRMKWLIVVGSLSMLLGATCLSLMFNVPNVGQGLSFPATSLACSCDKHSGRPGGHEQHTRLWRSLGIVMGVSLSSLILQNALATYLDRLVTGHDKAKIIQRVRSSVRSIVDLDAKHQSRVRRPVILYHRSYSRSLRLVFISAMATFVIVNALVFAIKLPHLKKKKEPISENGEENER